MTTVIETTSKLLRSFEVCFRTSNQDPCFILDTEYITRTEVANALMHKPVIKLQLRTLATKEAPLCQLKPPTNEPQLEEEFMYVHKVKRQNNK